MTSVRNPGARRLSIQDFFVSLVIKGHEEACAQLVRVSWFHAASNTRENHVKGVDKIIRYNHADQFDLLAVWHLAQEPCHRGTGAGGQ